MRGNRKRNYEIYEACLNGTATQKELAEKYGVSVLRIQQIYKIESKRENYKANDEMYHLLETVWGDDKYMLIRSYNVLKNMGALDFDVFVNLSPKKIKLAKGCGDVMAAKFFEAQELIRKKSIS